MKRRQARIAFNLIETYLSTSDVELRKKIWRTLMINLDTPDLDRLDINRVDMLMTEGAADAVIRHCRDYRERAESSGSRSETD